MNFIRLMRLIYSRTSQTIRMNGLALALILFISAPMLFYNAIAWDFPKGFSGLYALFSERLIANHFKLPTAVPYYGPGGIPLVYPPLAIYVMGFLTSRFNIVPVDYLKVAPAVLSWLSLPPVYYLAKMISASRLKGLAAALLFGSAPAIYIMQVYSGGVIRAPAFIFCSTGLLLAYTGFENKNRTAVILSTLCFALTMVTHLGYVFFFAFSLMIFVLFHRPYGLRIKYSLAILLGGLLLASPWWLSMIMLNGSKVFWYALASHDSLGFTTRFLHPGDFSWLWKPLAFAFFNSPVLGGLAISGLIWCLINRHYQLPGWFLATWLLLSENWHHLVLVGSITGSIFLVDLGVLLTQKKHPPKASWGITGLVVGAGLLSNMMMSFPAIKASPALRLSETTQLGEWFQKETSPEARYLFLQTREDIAEWMPYFLHRTPAIGFWGSEWTGDYDRQYRLTKVDLPSCLSESSLECIEGLIDHEKLDVDYLILPSVDFIEPIKSALERGGSWRKTYENQDYQVWQRNQPRFIPNNQVIASPSGF